MSIAFARTLAINKRGQVKKNLHLKGFCLRKNIDHVVIKRFRKFCLAFFLTRSLCMYSNLNCAYKSKKNERVER